MFFVGNCIYSGSPNHCTVCAGSNYLNISTSNYGNCVASTACLTASYLCNLSY